MMKGFGWTILLFILALVCLDAFVPPQVHAPSSRGQSNSGDRFQPSEQFHASKKAAIKPLRRSLGHRRDQFNSQSSSDDSNDVPSSRGSSKKLTHSDILWKLKPPSSVTIWKRLWLKIAANLIRLDCFIKRQEPPLVLCPKGEQAVLEAHIARGASAAGFRLPFFKKRRQKIARFGFTTMAGPSNPPIQETVHDVYGFDANRSFRVGAIIYMFVEEEFRKREVGTLALQVISLIQNIQACDFTMLVVDDNGSGKLNAWYESKGYQRAPKLQTMLGSPNMVHGVSMMSPTNRRLPDDCQIQWW